jgi:hypothetical protein
MPRAGAALVGGHGLSCGLIRWRSGEYGGVSGGSFCLLNAHLNAVERSFAHLESERTERYRGFESPHFRATDQGLWRVKIHSRPVR